MTTQEWMFYEGQDCLRDVDDIKGGSHRNVDHSSMMLRRCALASMAARHSACQSAYQTLSVCLTVCFILLKHREGAMVYDATLTRAQSVSDALHYSLVIQLLQIRHVKLSLGQ